MIYNPTHSVPAEIEFDVANDDREMLLELLLANDYLGSDYRGMLV